ncbi:MAG: hypothetical protein IJG15_07090 [Lachnospiraceae bacterium]|nr:hypothetical protein [Lachnospiraceae bacterium]
MQEEISRAVISAIGEKDDIDLVLHRESWIIAQEEGKKPRLEKARYFSFMNRRKMWESDHIDIVVMTAEAEEAVKEVIRTRYGLTAYPPGADDPSSLLEVWA